MGAVLGQPPVSPQPVTGRPSRGHLKGAVLGRPPTMPGWRTGRRPVDQTVQRKIPPKGPAAHYWVGYPTS